MRVVVTTLVILAASLAFACDDVVGVRGSGDLVTEEYEFADFTDVEVSHTFRADISYSDSFSVSLEVDDNILELVEVTNEGGTLRLGLESGANTRDATMPGYSSSVTPAVNRPAPNARRAVMRALGSVF